MELYQRLYEAPDPAPALASGLELASRAAQLEAEAAKMAQVGAAAAAAACLPACLPDRDARSQGARLVQCGGPAVRIAACMPGSLHAPLPSMDLGQRHGYLARVRQTMEGWGELPTIPFALLLAVGG